MEHTAVRRLPRAGIDTIDHPDTALAAIAMAITRPLRGETILLLLDEARRGRAIVVVSGTAEPDQVIEVVECITQGEGCEHLGALVVASVRPDAAEHPGDVDRWLEMSDVASLVGVELLEWFVIGRTISCPRDQLGEAPRW
jgi:hypothetical protein